MHGDFALFATFTMALVTAFAGGVIARRLGLPSLVGYLCAGLVIGPFTIGFVGDANYMNQLAEMGVIFMMFGVGVHFSLNDLWSVRTIAIPGALLQMALGTLLGFLLAAWWGWSGSAGLVMGLAISVASTVVLLRGLTDHGLLSTMHGKVAVGWLVLEDLATVAILVVMPLLFGAHSGSEKTWFALGVTAVQFIAFIALMLFVGARLIPWLLGSIALTRSRELFILAVVAIALGVAFGAAAFFGVSLALGAFLAGVVLGESEVGHQVGAEVIPFRDIFSVLFFVSVGMLVNPMAILASWGQVLMLILLVVCGKWLINLSLGLILPASATTMLVVAAGLSQIGEFTFIVGSLGVSLGVLSQDQYGLILAAATVSIMVNPFLFDLIPTQEAFLKKFPFFWQRLNKSTAMPAALDRRMHDHIIIVGHGRVGKYIGHVLTQLHLPYVVVESDAVAAKAMQEAGIITLFGDAANSEILHHTDMATARALVVTVADETTAAVVVASAHAMAPHLPIIARAATESGVHRLAAVGACHIIHPELEGGLEIMRHTLLALGYPPGHIQPYVDAVRGDAYAAIASEGTRPYVLDQLLTATRGVEIAWQPVAAHSALVGKSMQEANLRALVGTSVIALLRDGHVIPNPQADTHFAVGDLVGVIGTVQELAATAALLDPTREQTPP
jgi:monovalent cation:H+ antiporter-2, CPA2 family